MNKLLKKISINFHKFILGKRYFKIFKYKEIKSTQFSFRTFISKKGMRKKLHLDKRLNTLI